MKSCKKKPEFNISENLVPGFDNTYMPLANFVTFMRISS